MNTPTGGFFCSVAAEIFNESSLLRDLVFRDVKLVRDDSDQLPPCILRRRNEMLTRGRVCWRPGTADNVANGLTVSRKMDGSSTVPEPERTQAERGSREAGCRNLPAHQDMCRPKRPGHGGECTRHKYRCSAPETVFEGGKVNRCHPLNVTAKARSICRGDEFCERSSRTNCSSIEACQGDQ